MVVDGSGPDPAQLPENSYAAEEQVPAQPRVTTDEPPGNFTWDAEDGDIAIVTASTTWSNYVACSAATPVFEASSLGDDSGVKKSSFQSLSMTSTMASADATTHEKIYKSEGSPQSSPDCQAQVKKSNSLPNMSSASPVSRVRSSPSSRTLGSRVRTGSEDINEEIQNIASFKGCEQLLRGSHLAVVLRNQASIFANSDGSAATYALSKTTKLIDAFISHNWCVPRWQKWLCLTFHFHLYHALALAFLSLTPLYVISICGWLPTIELEFARYPRSYIFRYVNFPVFITLLCFYRDIFRCFPHWSPVVFLDKTCIHQEDRTIQRKGIEKLGAFLCYSKTMVVCYTDMYLSKLWTMYEVASFMTLQPVEQMRVIPVMFPIVVMASNFFIFVSGCVALWPEYSFGLYHTFFFFVIAGSYGVMVVLRRWARSKLKIRSTVSQFTARGCKCSCESDRPLVYANIAALMRETQEIGKGASEEEALACFDNLVRNHMYDALCSSVGKYSMRYGQAFACGCPLFTQVQDALASLAYGMPVRHLCSYTLWYAFTVCVIVPASVMALSTWAERCLWHTGWQDYAYLLLGVMVTFTVNMFVFGMLDAIELWANESNIGMFLFVSVFLILTVMVRKEMDASSWMKSCGKATKHKLSEVAQQESRGESEKEATEECHEPQSVRGFDM